jgi:DUF4097 and DUF4098 domain-containing protein YvlB
MKPLLHILLVVSIVLSLQGCTKAGSHRAHASQKLTADHVAGAAMMLRTRNGSLDAEADAALAHVEISARFTCAGHTPAEAAERAAAADLSVSRRSDGTLIIEPIFPGGYRNGDGASLTLRLPDAHGVTAHSSNGKVRIRGFSGPLNATSSNGALVLVNHYGDAELRTSNGAITVQNLNGHLRAVTSNGEVMVADLAGSSHVRTSNGAISVMLHPEQTGPIDLSTSNGSIKAKVGPAFAGDVTLATSNGSVQVHDRAGRIKSQTMRRSSGRLVVGEGGPESRLDSSNGSVVLEIGG